MNHETRIESISISLKFRGQESSDTEKTEPIDFLGPIMSVGMDRLALLSANHCKTLTRANKYSRHMKGQDFPVFI
jgi:hypothetical protein